MGTRGLYGFRKNGVDKLTYNHFDSYPEGLGFDILRFCEKTDDSLLNRIFDLIVLVDEDSKPTEIQKKICSSLGYFDASVSNQNEDDWYCLLRRMQGNFNEYVRLAESNATIFMTDNASFIKDSLYCEYAYIVNLDDDVLEFYKGFRHNPEPENRYGMEPNSSGYYPCSIVCSIPLEEIRRNGAEEALKKMVDEEDED